MALFNGYVTNLFKDEISEPEKEKQDTNESKTEELRKEIEKKTCAGRRKQKDVFVNDGNTERI